MRSAAVLAAAVALLTTGCSASALDSSPLTSSALVTHERRGTAASPAALALAWSTPATQPSWLPADATRIRWIASTDGGADRAPAALRAVSASDLPDSCGRARHPAGPVITAAWTPARTPSDVRRCGNWLVAPVDGGYLAWTPAEPPRVD